MRVEPGTPHREFCDPPGQFRRYCHSNGGNRRLLRNPSNRPRREVPRESLTPPTIRRKRAALHSENLGVKPVPPCRGFCLRVFFCRSVQPESFDQEPNLLTIVQIQEGTLGKVPFP